MKYELIKKTGITAKRLAGNLDRDTAKALAYHNNKYAVKGVKYIYRHDKSVVFENDFCTIIEKSDYYLRIDKVTGKEQKQFSYYKDGELIQHPHYKGIKT